MTDLSTPLGRIRCYLEQVVTADTIGRDLILLDLERLEYHLHYLEGLTSPVRPESVDVTAQDMRGERKR